MATHCVCSVVFLLVLSTTSLQFEKGSCVRIEITPNEAVETENSEIQISCLTDGVNVKKIVYLEISSDKVTPLVSIVGSSWTLLDSGVPKRYQAKGLVAKTIGQSYLNLTISRPITDDSGTYTCLMSYVDQSGKAKEESAADKLTVQNLDIHQLYHRVVLLEQVSKDLQGKTFDLTKQYNRIDVNMANFTAGTKTNTNNYTPVSFSASIDKYIHIHPKMVLVFPEIVIKEGNGYNETTGIFTAPLTGLYAFHLVLTVSEDGATVVLYSNDKVLATLIAYDRSRTWEQSTVSSVVKLEAGDEVKAVVDRIYGKSPLIDQHRFSVFSGYLIHPL